MTDVIQLLPEHVANQIAAGEVIQRPASVVKELLDNSVDAGSTEISLIIKEAGKTLVQVIDNGLGLSETDARMCWERHATSKIKTAEDLFKIKTMGFRGEALASIASVSQVEMKSKRATDNFGTLIRIEASQVKKQENISFVNGTSIAVKNLFYNIPARRNFLKSNPVEYRHILDEFTRCAMANPHLAFNFHHNDDEIFNLRPGSLLQRICSLFGEKYRENLLAFEEQTSIVNVTGFIGTPELAKKMRGEQFFFVNNRYIKDPYLNHAVIGAFEGIISKDQFPFYCIKIEIEPEHIDVNIHPTKTEIKFDDERNVYQIIRAVVRKALGENINMPQSNDFDDNMFFKLQLESMPKQSDVTIGQKDFSKEVNFSDRGATIKSNNDWQKIYEASRNQSSASKQFDFSNPPAEKELFEETNYDEFFQLHKKFVVSQIKSGLLIVDQQSAHERILYEKFCSALEKSPILSQQKLFPRTIVVNSSDYDVLIEILPKIKLLGFDINEFGKNTFVVNGIPSEMQNCDEQEMIESIIEQYKNSRTDNTQVNHILSLNLAKRTSIKTGLKLNGEEMRTLIDQLFACSNPKYSPDGKPCILTLSLEEISRLFK